MARIIVTNHLTLDGVMQSPGGRDEDRRGGFDLGGWAVPNNDEVMVRVLGVGMAKPGSLLLGRFTYEAFYAYWPHQTDNPYTEVLNNSQKFVASRTLSEPLPWMNSTLLEGDAADAAVRLKDERDEDIVVLGSGELIRSLMARDLVDEYLLLVHPLVLGQGRRLFPDGGPSARLRLTDAVTTTKGVVIGRYQSEAG